MTDSENAFETELDIFRTEVDVATQFFYAFFTIHAVAAQNKGVVRFLNESPLFWNTTLGAMQTAAFIALGRIFDQKSAHNVDRVLRLAQRNLEMFSKSALGKRKQGPEKEPPEWLPEYLRQAYEPKASDFRKLRTFVGKRRKIYEARYRDLRRKVFAHKELSSHTDHAAITALFAMTDIREVQQLLAFLRSIYQALWHLFFNGRKPVLRPRRYSVKSIRDRPPPAGVPKEVQEQITLEVEAFLKSATGVF